MSSKTLHLGNFTITHRVFSLVLLPVKTRLAYSHRAKHVIGKGYFPTKVFRVTVTALHMLRSKSERACARVSVCVCVFNDVTVEMTQCIELTSLAVMSSMFTSGRVQNCRRSMKIISNKKK